MRFTYVSCPPILWQKINLQSQNQNDSLLLIRLQLKDEA